MAFLYQRALVSDPARARLVEGSQGAGLSARDACARTAPQGSGALDPDGILTSAIRAVRQEVGDECLVMSDVCLDEFTDHGHCGVLTRSGVVDNDAKETGRDTFRRWIEAPFIGDCKIDLAQPVDILPTPSIL